MKRRVGVAEVVALWPWAGVPGGANRFGLTTPALAFTPRQHARFADVAGDGRGMWATTHGAIVGHAWLEGTRRFAFG